MSLDSAIHCSPLYTVVLARINTLSSLPVTCALSKLACSPKAPNSDYIQLSDAPATLFTSPGDIDSSFNIWLQLPVPNVLIRSALRHALSSASEEFPDLEVSLEVNYASHLVYLPVWILDLWPSLGTLVFHGQEWSLARSALFRIARTSSELDHLVQNLVKKLSVVPLDATVTSLNPFRTSHLPGLILESWLSDEHINAGCNFINTHPNRSNNILALHSFFLGSLRLRSQRRLNNCRQRTLPIDALVANGSVNELLIPVHRPSHWALLYVDLITRQYSYIDSLNTSNNSAPASCVDPVNDWLSEALNRDIVLRPGPRPFALGAQSDSHSCGVAVLSSMAHYALGGDFSAWFQHSAKAHRLRWALTLIESEGNTVTANNQVPLDIDPDDFEDEHFSPEVPFEDAYSLSNSDISAHNSTPEDLGAPGSFLISESSHTMYPTPIHSPATKQPLIQSTLPFKSIPRSDWLAQESRRYHGHKEESQRERDQLKLAEEKKKMSRRERERTRKRAQRARQKALKSSWSSQQTFEDSPNTKANVTPSTRSTIVSLSRPHRTARRGHSKTTSKPIDCREQPGDTGLSRINWTTPLIWSQIEHAARTIGYPWSPTDIVRYLQRLNPATFAMLRPQRLSQWRDHRFPDELRWTESHMRSIKAGDNLIRSNAGRNGVLHNRPDLIRTIKNRLLDLRKAGIALDIDTICGYMSGVIRYSIPDAFTRCDKSGRTFKCSREFVRAFLRHNLGWSIRKATRAAQKLPPNVNTVLLHAFLRFARIVRDEEVPACCIVNADQTQVVYNAGSHSTWNAAGERQVYVLGLEEKRAFTLLVAASLSGAILPLQAIYGGKTWRSVPSKDAPGFSEAHRLGFLLDYSGSDTYWSTQETMRRFVSRILAPYFRTQIEQHQLPPTQRCIFQIDCWSVHRSAEFRSWMGKNYPWILILYVPGGCTGLFQACDVGLQRVLKLAIRQAAHNDIVNETLAALESGTPPQAIVNDKGLHTLRNRSINWILCGFRAINRSDIVQKAFTLCSVPGTSFNLSHESLTSRDARQAILGLGVSDPVAYANIMAAGQSLPDEEQEEDPEADITTDSFMEPEEPGDDFNRTVDEVTSFVLTATSASAAAGPLEQAGDSDSGDALGDYTAFIQPSAPTGSVTRSGRATRVSSRYRGGDWLTH